MKLGTFSWRLLVGWFLLIFGVVCSVMACGNLVVYHLSRTLTPPRPLYLVPIRVALVAWLIGFAGGLFWWWAGRHLLHKKGWWPLLYFAVGYLCIVGGGTLWGKANFVDVPVEQWDGPAEQE